MKYRCRPADDGNRRRGVSPHLASPARTCAARGGSDGLDSTPFPSPPTTYWLWRGRAGAREGQRAPRPRCPGEVLMSCCRQPTAITKFTATHDDASISCWCRHPKIKLRVRAMQGRKGARARSPLATWRRQRAECQRAANGAMLHVRGNKNSRAAGIGTEKNEVDTAFADQNPLLVSTHRRRCACKRRKVGVVTMRCSTNCHLSQCRAQRPAASVTCAA